MKNVNLGELLDSDERLDGEQLRVAIVRARFNFETTSALEHSCIAELKRLRVKERNITVYEVPGALEIPVALSTLAKNGNSDVLIALGAIIRGETYHFEIVANESSRGVSQVALAYQIPIINQILTVENQLQALERQEIKGRDAARSAIEMANLLLDLRKK